MSLFSGIEKTIERGFRKWTERVFGPADSDQLLLVHRGILEEIESKVQTVQRGRHVFPYHRLTVRLVSPDPDRRALYQMAFGQDRRLESDIREALSGAGCDAAPALAVEIETAETGPRTFEIEYSVRDPRSAMATVPAPAPVRLVVIRGAAREAVYLLDKSRLNIGRMDELTDAEQRVVRRNDIVFDEGAAEANATVSRSHAHIRAEGETGEYRIADDGSEYGTRIFRDGRSIEVAKGARRGERLRPGDEIYLGRACLRFER